MPSVPQCPSTTRTADRMGYMPHAPLGLRWSAKPRPQVSAQQHLPGGLPFEDRTVSCGVSAGWLGPPPGHSGTWHQDR